MARSGFSLFEVVLALLLITSGLLALGESFTQITRLVALGRERTRMAMVLESRVDRLRAEVRQGRCLPPGPGSSRSGDGILEWWSTKSVGSSIEVVVTALGPGRSTVDTVVVRFPCG